jgi:hypothetical protein
MPCRSRRNWMAACGHRRNGPAHTLNQFLCECAGPQRLLVVYSIRFRRLRHCSDVSLPSLCCVHHELASSVTPPSANRAPAKQRNGALVAGVVPQVRRNILRMLADARCQGKPISSLHRCVSDGVLCSNTGTCTSSGCSCRNGYTVRSSPSLPLCDRLYLIALSILLRCRGPTAKSHQAWTRRTLLACWELYWVLTLLPMMHLATNGEDSSDILDVTPLVQARWRCA